jgi:GTPase SAR1 family protein
MLLVGNKCDLDEQRQVREKKEKEEKEYKCGNDTHSIPLTDYPS